MDKRYNNHTKPILVLIGIRAIISVVSGIVLWIAGNQISSYTEGFAADMTQYDGTGVADGYAVIADLFGTLGTGFVAIFMYALAIVTAIYTIWAFVFMILNWALRFSYVGVRIVNTIYSLPALSGGLGILFSSDLSRPAICFSMTLLLYAGIILLLAYTGKVISLEDKELQEGRSENSEL